jgi:spore photoproduct lyase
VIDTLYIEDDIADHPRARRVFEQFPRATKVRCERYTEVFNPASQNFRLQKRRPALILARKFQRFVLETPNEFGVGGAYNYYFSHMLNCIYDCRYCFLQGMYRSAHYVLFVNYEDFQQSIETTLRRRDGAPVWFFSGYDCDSLALEPVTGFVKFFVPLLARHSNAWLELRTKSTQVRSLLRMEPPQNCVVAFSFTPEEMSRALEHKVPPVQRRIETMLRLQEHGWRVGLRFDPLLYHEDYRSQYSRLFADIFRELHADSIHSVSIGTFRIPAPYHRKMVRLYPDEPLFAGPLARSNGLISYYPELQQEMMDFCRTALSAYVPAAICFSCMQPY